MEANAYTQGVSGDRDQVLPLAIWQLLDLGHLSYKMTVHVLCASMQMVEDSWLTNSEKSSVPFL